MSLLLLFLRLFLAWCKWRNDDIKTYAHQGLIIGLRMMWWWWMI